MAAKKKPKTKKQLEAISIRQRAREKALKIQKETTKHFATTIAAAFAFIMALVWRDALRKIIDNIILKLGLPETAYFYEIIVAVIVTFICIAGIMMISKYNAKEE